MDIPLQVHDTDTEHRSQLGIPVYVYRLASLDSMSKEIFAVKPERRYQRMYVQRFRLSCYASVFLSTELPCGSSWRDSRSHCAPISLIPPPLRQYLP